MSSLGRLSAVPADVWKLIGDSVPADVPRKRGSIELHDLQHHRALIDLGYSADWGIPYPVDLHHLAMACRTLYDLYVPMLFRHVHLGIDRVENFLAALDKRPHLYQHLRSLTFHHLQDPRPESDNGEGHNYPLQWEIASKAPNLITLRLEPLSDLSSPCPTLDLPDLEVFSIAWLKARSWHRDPSEPLDVDLGKLIGPSTRPRVLCAEGIAISACPTLADHLDRVQHLTLQCAYQPDSSLLVGRYLEAAPDLTSLKLIFRTADWPMILQRRPSSWLEACRSKLRSVELYRHEFMTIRDEDGRRRTTTPQTVEEVFADEPEQSPSLLSSFSDFDALRELTLPIAHPSALHLTDSLPAALKIFILAMPWAETIKGEQEVAIKVDALKILCSHVWKCLKAYMSDGRAPALQEIRVEPAVPWLYWALQHSLTFPDGKREIDNFDRFRSFCASQGIAFKVGTLTFEEYWQQQRALSSRRSRKKAIANAAADMTIPQRPSKSLIYRYGFINLGEDNNRTGETPPSPGTEHGYGSSDYGCDSDCECGGGRDSDSEGDSEGANASARRGSNEPLENEDGRQSPISEGALSDIIANEEYL